MQAKGSLAETSLRSLLESAQSERATGTLTVRADGAEPSTLYFLFGHLFHASGESGTGDDVVVSALTSTAGEFEFDARAKLPADETVRGSIPELLDRAAQLETRPQPEPAYAPAPRSFEPGPQPVSEPPPGRAWMPPAPPPSGPPSAPPPAPPASTARPAQPALPEAPIAPGLGDGVKYRPTPKHGREPIPVPHGKVVYDSLKASFVDFPRLITTLERERYTGYVRLLTEESSGLIFFREGQALECVFDRGDEPTVELSTRGLKSFFDAVSSGSGVLDVVSLSPELVDGLYQLTTSDPIYTELYASWVDPRALLEFLANRHLTGTVMVQSNDAIGVILLAGGDLAGAYTSRSREIADNAEAVLSLCDDPKAMIEVKATDEVQRRVLDVEQVIGPRRGPAAAPGDPARAQRPAAATLPPGPQPTLPAARPVSADGQPDWDAIVSDLEQYSDSALGSASRARKVREALEGSERSREGLEATINQIPEISILFVDTSRMDQLASELRERLHTQLGA
ncbi:MAG: DUF4388 domain-containing protein [Candidatus Dormiibacterota bacterium]